MSAELHQIILSTIALIPKGKISTYGQIAKLAGLPKHARLVGYVLKHLDATSTIPWHRVVNAQGKISTQRCNEKSENIQQLKLEAENVFVVNGRISLKQYQWIP
ncbi:MGMT family protein [Acinetobacter amyesii]|uniref:MGMT family protein n=1 Tax=Acinetobacter amyesii TaxID=2942470 RepID=UPI0020BDF2B4|nr:MGMT family protein [Acinetobacter amyesii]MCL6232995.1 MGMT family protein [Acinetobacter amyesii]